MGNRSGISRFLRLAGLWGKTRKVRTGRRVKEIEFERPGIFAPPLEDEGGNSAQDTVARACASRADTGVAVNSISQGAGSLFCPSLESQKGWPYTLRGSDNVGVCGGICGYVGVSYRGGRVEKWLRPYTFRGSYNPGVCGWVSGWG